MSRLAGIVTSLPADAAEARIFAMTNCMVREPAERPHLLCIPDLGCYVGWVPRVGRAAIDGTVAHRRDGKILVLSGEHFGDRTASDLLLSATGDADFEAALRELNGWFAGVFIDLVRGTILLFNDRFAIRRLYYRHGNDGFVFASEAKAILGSSAETRRFDPDALAEFVSFGSVLNDRSLFADVFTLPGASAWTIRPTGPVQKRRYFSTAEWERQPTLPEDEFYARLKATLSRVVPRYFSGADAVAVSLTGGVDTRVIMAFAGTAARPALSYTFGGMYRDCFDVHIARQVARSCGFRHQVVPLGSEFLADFPHYAESIIWITDGAQDIRGSHELYLHEQVRHVAPVRLTGNYGSEIFRAARTFRPRRLTEGLFDRGFTVRLRHAAGSFAEINREHPVSFAVMREVPLHLFGRLRAAESHVTLRSPYTDNELVALAYQAPADARSSLRLWDRLILEERPPLASIPTDRAHVANRSSFATPAIRLYNYLLFKGEWYYESGMPHWIARLDKQIWGSGAPPWFTGSHKIEHYRRWFRDQLFEYLQSVLREAAHGNLAWVNWKRANEMMTAHRRGDGNFVNEINKLVTISLIQKLVIDTPRMAASRPHRALVVHAEGMGPQGPAGGEHERHWPASAVRAHYARTQ
jgi:asparagine synthase (glutamine-hydrolysing)